MEYIQIKEKSREVLDNYKEMDEDLANRLIDDLSSIIDPKFISRDWALRVPYSQDTSGGGTDNVNEYRTPDIVVLPTNVQEVAHICSIALKYKVPVNVISTGLNTTAMALPLFRGIMIDLKRMNRILEIDKEGLTITVEPFVSYARAQAELEPLDLRINIPGAPNSVSIVANNLFIGMKFYSAKFGYGAMEIVGLEYVLPDGTILRTGALLSDPIETTSKYKQGIHSEPSEGNGRVCVQSWGPDLTGLPQQGVGGNGIVTKMCIKIYRKLKNTEILCYGFKDLENTTRILAEICGQDIGYGALMGASQDNAQAAQHSNKDVEIFQAMSKSSIKTMKSGIKMMLKSIPLMFNKSYREIFKGFMALGPVNYVFMAFLIGTKRKIEYDNLRIQNILKDKSINSEKIRDATPYQKHNFWPYNDEAEPEYIYKLVKNSGMKDFRYDWLLRGGKFLDYCDITARMMRKTTGLSIKSSRMTYDKVKDVIDFFIKKLEKHFPEAVEEDKWGVVIIPGIGSHFICLEYVITYDPRNQEEKDKTFKVFREFIVESMEKGIYFTNHSKLYRDSIEKMMMPKIWELTKEIRDSFQATVLCPH